MFTHLVYFSLNEVYSRHHVILGCLVFTSIVYIPFNKQPFFWLEGGRITKGSFQHDFLTFKKINVIPFVRDFIVQIIWAMCVFLGTFKVHLVSGEGKSFYCYFLGPFVFIFLLANWVIDFLC